MGDFNITYKPHIFLAKGGEDRKYYFSVVIPVEAGGFVAEVDHEIYDSEKHDIRYKACNICNVTVGKKKIEVSPGIEVKPIDPLLFVGFTCMIRKNESCEKLAVIVRVKAGDYNGHQRDAIHTYDDASGPISL